MVHLRGERRRERERSLFVALQTAWFLRWPPDEPLPTVESLLAGGDESPEDGEEPAGVEAGQKRFLEGMKLVLGVKRGR